MKLHADAPTIDDIRGARARIAPYVRRTPVFSPDGTVYKLEFLQVTGSFKPRGAFNTALQLDSAARERGLVAVSGGNHGLAVAYVARTLGMRATIVMPSTTPSYIVDRARADGAEVLLFPTIGEAFDDMERRVAAGQTALHPFDDVRVIAGQGTVGLELLEDIPDLSTVIASIGGGGLVSGVAVALKALKPDVKVYGVETEGADAMRRALDAHRPVTLERITSIARTLGAPSASERTLAIVSELVEDVVVVSDAEAVRSIVQLHDDLKVTLEPAAACCHAALRLGRIPRPKSGSTAIVLCGGNVELEEIIKWRRDFGV